MHFASWWCPVTWTDDLLKQAGVAPMLESLRINWDAKRIQGLVGIALGMFMLWWEKANGIALPLIDVPVLGLQSVAHIVLTSGVSWWGIAGNGDAAYQRYKKAREQNATPPIVLAQNTTTGGSTPP